MGDPEGNAHMVYLAIIFTHIHESLFMQFGIIVNSFWL
jgi:hypothetical protein